MVGSKMASKKFNSFYLSLRGKRESLNFFMWQFYSQLFEGLDFLGKHIVVIDGKETTLTAELMRDKVAENITTRQELRSMDDDFILFNGAFIDAFKDGSLLLRLLHCIVETLGDTTAPLEYRYKRYQADGRLHSQLRVCYWYIDTNFVCQLPHNYQAAFTVDCMLYSEWRMDHPNLIGLHLLALIWMLGVRQFKQFVPEEIQSCAQVASPIFQHFLPQKGIEIRYGDTIKKSA